MHIKKSPITHSDESFLFALYSSTRQEELALVPWDDAQKEAFLQMQFQAQLLHYKTKFPNASFLLLELNGQPIGRFYTAESDDEIRILDLTLAPEFRNQKIGSHLLGEIIAEAQSKNKSVQIYLEDFSRAKSLFARLGFVVVRAEEIYRLWRRSAENSKNAAANNQSGL